MKHFKIFLLIGALTMGISGSKVENNDSQQAIFAGSWSGTYSGGDAGTWNATIDADGIVEGEAFSNNLKQSLPLSGSIDNSGDFRATVGSATNGATFKGAFTQESSSGTWENKAYEISGSWTGSKD